MKYKELSEDLAKIITQIWDQYDIIYRKGYQDYVNELLSKVNKKV